MGLRVETGLMNPDTNQYAGRGQAAFTIETIIGQAQRLERLGFDGGFAPEAGHDPFLPLVLAAEHTTRLRLGTTIAIAFGTPTGMTPPPPAVASASASARPVA